MNNDLSPLSDDAPLLSLIEKPLHDMSETELREHTLKLRELSSSSQTIKTKINREQKAKAKPAPKKKAIDIDKYLNL